MGDKRTKTDSGGDDGSEPVFKNWLAALDEEATLSVDDVFGICLLFESPPS